MASIISEIENTKSKDCRWRRNDQLSRITYSQGGSSRYEYDGVNRLTHQAFGGELARYAYEYDANGNQTGKI